jgi:hypothetical protein
MPRQNTVGADDTVLDARRSDADAGKEVNGVKQRPALRVRHDKFTRLDNGGPGIGGLAATRNPRLPAKLRNLQGFISAERTGVG